MPLKLYERPNGIWHIRGTVQGRRVDESARTRVKSEAEAIRAQLEADLFKRAVYGDAAVATFAEAAEGYMMAGGMREHMTPLLIRFGNKKLSEIGQGDLDRMASESPQCKPSTLLRRIYAPMSAVMNFAASPAGGQLCKPIAFRKPKLRNTRVEYLTPEDAELWLKALPNHLAPLVAFFLATGCRASEALDLEWKDVSPENNRVVFWETKANYARSVDLQKRAQKLLPERHDKMFKREGDDGKMKLFNPVFLNSRGEPWHGYDAINLMMRRTREARIKEIESGKKLSALAPVHCHLFRHTWATWAYACTRDLTFLMQSGGWRSLTMVARYTHAASPDLAQSVMERGWEFSGREISGLTRKRRKA